MNLDNNGLFTKRAAIRIRVRLQRMAALRLSIVTNRRGPGSTPHQAKRFVVYNGASGHVLAQVLRVFLVCTTP